MKTLLALLLLFPILAGGLTFSDGKQVSEKTLLGSLTKNFDQNEPFCLPDDISSGLGCKWSISEGTLGTEHQIQIVSSDEGHPVRDGKLSIRFEVRPGECAGSDENPDKVGWENQPANDCTRTNGKSERAELSGRQSWGSGEYWYSFSIYAPKDFKAISPSSLKMFQFHTDNKDKSGILKYPQKFHFEAKDANYMPFNNVKHTNCKCDGPNDNVSKVAITKAEMIGRWNDVLMNFKWSHKENGFFKVWANGILKYEYYGPTLWEAGDKAYIKFGIYRNWLEYIWATGSDGGTTIIYFDEIRIGKTEDEVTSSLSKLAQQEYFYKKSEIEIIEEEIDKLKKDVVINYDIEKSRKINKLKKKLRKLEYEKTMEN